MKKLAAMAGLFIFCAIPALAEEPNVVELTQTACQFIEPEGGDLHLKDATPEQCRAENSRSGDRRLEQAKTLRLEAGAYIFRVTNRDVAYVLGFWLRGNGLVNRATLPAVSGGGIDTGESKEYSIVLEPGEYVYSCPLNPTPDYKLIVE
ncbi:MAG: hypothetical protein RQ867_10375 [Mariprofundaceae bacterium]|nr:hypothetical protein [Mariprofundaceae bacterium]